MKKYQLIEELIYPGLKGGKGAVFMADESGNGYLADPADFLTATNLVGGKVRLPASLVENDTDFFEDISTPDSPFRIEVTNLRGQAAAEVLEANEAITQTIKLVQLFYPGCAIETV